MTETIRTLILPALVLVAAVLAIWSQAKGRKRVHYVAKPLATALIIAVAALAATPVPAAYKTLILAGLALLPARRHRPDVPRKAVHRRPGRLPRGPSPLHLRFQAGGRPPGLGGGLPALHPLRPADVLPPGPGARSDEAARPHLYRGHHDHGRIRIGPLRRPGRHPGAPGLHRGGAVPDLGFGAGLRPLRQEVRPGQDPRPWRPISRPSCLSRCRFRTTVRRGRRSSRRARPRSFSPRAEPRTARRPSGRCVRARNSRARS